MTQEIERSSELELHELAKRINSREETLEQLKGKAIESASNAVTEAILQGQDLIKAKAMVPHGLWLDWLHANCPTLSERHAYRYMKVASNLTRVSNANSLREALLLCDEGEEQKAESKQSWPEYLEGLYRFGRVFKFVESHPLMRWPQEGRDKLKSDLEPIAKELWPEKFA